MAWEVTRAKYLPQQSIDTGKTGLFIWLLLLFLSQVVDTVILIFKQDLVLQWVGKRICKVNELFETTPLGF